MGQIVLQLVHLSAPMTYLKNDKASPSAGESSAAFSDNDQRIYRFHKEGEMSLVISLSRGIEDNVGRIYRLEVGLWCELNPALLNSNKKKPRFD